MKRTLTGLSCLVVSAVLAAQDPITIPLRLEKKLANESHGFVPLYEYDRAGVVLHEGTRQQIVAPAFASDTVVAYGFVYFTGRPGALDREILFLVEGYDGAEPRFHVDLDNDLDLTDDESAVEREDTGKYLMRLVAASDPEHTFTVRLGFFRDRPEVQASPEVVTRYEELFAGYVQRMGGVPVSALHWFGDQRLNVRSASTRVGELEFQIGVHDWNCNGTYADPEDMVVVGEFGAEYLPRSKASGATVLGTETLVQLGEQTFEVVEVDPAGTFVRIMASDKPYTRLRDGGRLPDFDLTLLDGTQAALSAFVRPGKVLLIDFWGHWCGGCIQAIPVLVKAEPRLREHLTILGIHSGDHDQAREIVEREGMSWAQAEASDELTQAFLVDKWPYYVLVDDRGRITKLNIGLAPALKVAEGLVVQRQEAGK